MSTRFSSLRVTAELDATQYVQAAEKKAQADRGMVESGRAAAAGVEATERKVTAASRGFDRFRASIDPAFASQRKMEVGVQRLNAALESGKISTAEYSRLIGSLEGRFGTAATSMARSSQAIAAGSQSYQRFGGVAQQAGYQIGDFAVQVAGGQNAVVAFTQQASQMLGVFGPIGAVAGAALAIFGGLSAAFMRSGDSAATATEGAETYKRALEAMVDIQRDAAAAQGALNGKMTDSRMAALEAAASLARLEEFKLKISELNDLFGPSQRELDAARLKVIQTETAIRQGERKIAEERTAESAKRRADLAQEAADAQARYAAMRAGGEAALKAEQDLQAARKMAAESADPQDTANDYLALIRSQREATEGIDKFGKATETAKKAQQAFRDEISAVSDEVVRLASARDDALAGYEMEIEALGLELQGREEAADWLRAEVQLRERLGALYPENAEKLRALWQEQRALNEQLKDQKKAQRESEQAWKDYAREVARTAENISGDVSEALWDSMTDERKGQSALEWFKDWGRRLGIEMLKQQIILPITAQVVGSVPGLFGVETPAGAAGASGGQSGAGGMAGDAMSLGGLFASGGQSTMLRGIGSSIALSGAGQSLGLSTGAAAAGSFRAAQEVGMASAGSTLTSSGSLLADGLGSSPWGIVGSLGAKAMGLGSGNAMIDGAAGMVGSIGGGMAGSALMGAQLGAAAGPIGAAIGAFIAIAASTLLKSSPTNGAAGVEFDPITGEITRASHANKGNSEDNLKALTDGVVPAVTLATQSLARAGVDISESITDMNFGNRDETSFRLAGGAMGTRTINGGSTGNARDLVGDIIEALIDGADAVPAILAERMHLLNFSDPEGMVASIEFISGFEDAIASMTRGSVDFAAQIEAVAKAEIASATEAVTKFQSETARLALDTDAAADATRAYVEQLIGLREPAAAMTATEQAVQALEVRFAALGPLLEAVGLTAEDAAEGLRKAKGAMADQFNSAIEREILAKTDPTALALRDLTAQFEGLRREAEAVGGDIGQLNRLYALQREEVEAQRVAVLEADVTRAYEAESRARQEVRDGAYGLALSMRDLRQSLLLDTNLSPLSAPARLAEAKRQYDETLAASRLGDLQAGQRLTQIGPQYLEALKAVRSTASAEYKAGFDGVQSDLQDVETVAERHVRIADEQLGVMRSQMEALGLINTSVMSLEEALAAYNAAVNPAAAVGAGGANDYRNGYGNPEIAMSLAEAEAAYLAANPDVAAAVASGQFTSASHHWQTYGASEGRTFPTTGPINQPAANSNWEAIAAVNGGSPVGYDFSANREVSYLSANPDVLAAWEAGAFGAGVSAAEAARQHFTDYGRDEGRSFLGGGTTRPGEVVRVHNEELLYTGPTTHVFNRHEAREILSGGSNRTDMRGVEARLDRVASAVERLIGLSARAGEGTLDRLDRVADAAEAQAQATAQQRAAAA